MFFCIFPLFEVIDYTDHLVDEYNGYFVHFILLYSIIMSMLTLILVFFEKFLLFKIVLSTSIFGLNLGILTYFTIIIRGFWVYSSIGLRTLQLASIISIFCSIPIVLLSYFQIKSKKHMKFSKEVLQSRIKLFYLRLGTLVAYTPIIAGIFFSMTSMPVLAYFSWNIFSLWPGIDFMTSWIFHDDYTTNFPVVSLLWIELVIFIFGFGLFLHGLICLVKAKKEKIDIVKTGLYKYIRHPQNLGIIIGSLPFCLYVPFFGDSGLKVGDIFSWMLFFLLIVIYSDVEEFHMVKRYPAEYRLYRAKTGFFIPRIIKTKNKRVNLEIKHYLFRWLLLVGVYIFLISILTFILSKFPLLLLRYYT